MTAQEIYDFEGVFENAFVLALEGQGFPNVYSVIDALEFQQIRPRIEVKFDVGTERNPLWLLPDSTGTNRSSFWVGNTLYIDIITATSAPAKEAHGVFRASVRAALSLAIQNVVNNVDGLLTNHKLQMIYQSSQSYAISPQDGYQKTRFSFNVEFSIQADSLSQYP